MLLEAVLLHEFDDFLTELDRVAADLPPRDAVVECFTQGIRLTREIPLLARLAETEPDLITAAGAASHSSLVLGSADRVAGTLRRAGATMPDDELGTVAELMLRVAWTYLLNPRGGLDVRTKARSASTPVATWRRWCPEVPGSSDHVAGPATLKTCRTVRTTRSSG